MPLGDLMPSQRLQEHGPVQGLNMGLIDPLKERPEQIACTGTCPLGPGATHPLVPQHISTQGALLARCFVSRAEKPVATD